MVWFVVKAAGTKEALGTSCLENSADQKVIQMYVTYTDTVVNQAANRSSFRTIILQSRVLDKDGSFQHPGAGMLVSLQLSWRIVKDRHGHCRLETVREVGQEVASLLRSAEFLQDLGHQLAVLATPSDEAPPIYPTDEVFDDPDRVVEALDQMATSRWKVIKAHHVRLHQERRLVPVRKG